MEFKDTPASNGPVKRSNASSDSSAAVTPATAPSTDPSIRGAAAASAGRGMAVLYWQDPFQTGIFFGGALTLFMTWTWLAYGSHGVTLLQGKL